MSTAWLFDVGNTRTKSAPLVGALAGEVRAHAHADDVLAGTRADHELQAEPADATAAWAHLPDRFERAYVASVAGAAVTSGVLQALTHHTRQIVRVRTSAAFDGLRIAYADPSRLGVDRFLALIAARDAGDVLVVGVGTALTVDLLDAHGLHHGGALAPSPTLMRQALHGRVPALPGDGGAVRDFADDTDDALATGCIDAALGLVDRLHARAEARLGGPVQLLLHGGGAAALAPALPGAVLRPELVIDGLARWAHADAACVDG